jgi:hypothetical protein
MLTGDLLCTRFARSYCISLRHILGRWAALIHDMSERIRLKFNGLPTFESTPLFFTLANDVDSRLRTLPATYARCNAALRFMSNIGADAGQLHVRAEEVDGMRVAYLRAALMEFAGMEETLVIDLGRGPSPMRISHTQNAMLVALRELRNVQVHLIRSDLLSSKRSAVWRYEGKEEAHELTALTIPRPDLDRLKNPRTAAYCNRADFERAVDWLADAQEHWGIADVVMRGIWAYAEAIVDAHAPSNDMSVSAVAIRS